MSFEYRSSDPLRRVIRLMVTTRPVAWLSSRFLPGIDRLAFRLTSGRLTPSALVTGLPVVQMTTVGARSGRPRTVRLLGIPVGDGYLVIAANFGEKRNPAWYHNVSANPRVTVTVGSESGDFEVRELAGAERDDGFDRALELNPGWRRFREQAGARDIPVLHLSAAR